MQELFDYLLLHNANNIKSHRGVSISQLAVRKGTYKTPGGDKQPCIKVWPDKTDRTTYYRFVPLYRMVGPVTVMMQEFCGGDWNTEEELGFKWSDFSMFPADVKKFVLYAFI